jgi:hydroxymethylbilane synthase
VLVLREGESLADLPSGARVGTGSPRRIGQIRHLRGDLRFEGVRGNVDTRLRKLREGRIEALVLALAGLNRIGATGARFLPFPLDQVLPAPGQGALGIELRESDGALARAVASALDHPPTAAAARAERALLKGLGGGCQMPVGALATVDASTLTLLGAVAARDGSRLLKDEIHGTPEAPEAAGAELARRLLEAGAAELLAEIRPDGERK